MHEFEFYFSFYGLLLGLSAATLVVRFADALGEHGKRRIGLLAPLLGIFVLLDVSSFWIWAWRARDFFVVVRRRRRRRLVPVTRAVRSRSAINRSAHATRPG